MNIKLVIFPLIDMNTVYNTFNQVLHINGAFDLEIL